MLSNLSNSNLFETANFSGPKYSNSFGSWLNTNVVKNPFINPVAIVDKTKTKDKIKTTLQNLDGSAKDKQAIIDAANQAIDQTASDAYNQGAADAITNMANQASNTTIVPSENISRSGGTIMGMPSKAVYIGGAIGLSVIAFFVIKSFKS